MRLDPINLRIGKLGEQIAADFIVNKGFKVVCRNYRKKSGEIDIVAKNKSIIHFIEVKSVSRENLNDTGKSSDHRPEENVHQWKTERLKRAISLYIHDKFYEAEPEWEFDVVTVEIDERNMTARVNFIKDIII